MDGVLPSEFLIRAEDWRGTVIFAQTADRRDFMVWLHKPRPGAMLGMHCTETPDGIHVRSVNTASLVAEYNSQRAGDTGAMLLPGDYIQVINGVSGGLKELLMDGHGLADLNMRVRRYM